MKRGSTDICGILAIDKPVGITSHDVVYAVRKATGEKRVGHCGTLDPLASGLMLVCVGPATRLSNYLMAKQKTYAARIAFGTATNTDDAEGEVICTCDVPANLGDESFSAEFLNSLIGKHQQTPPSFSAIKKDGVRAYKAARKGEALSLEAREIEVFEAELTGTNGTGPKCPEKRDKRDRPQVSRKTGQTGPASSVPSVPFWDVSVTVSKGTYIRALARDIGRQLGTCAHLAALRRTSCGGIDISRAISLEELKNPEQHPPLSFIDPISALGLPVLELNSQQAQAVTNGVALSLQHDANLLALTYNSSLMAIYKNTHTGFLKPEVVIPGGVSCQN